jgi:hypothetical protein
MLALRPAPGISAHLERKFSSVIEGEMTYDEQQVFDFQSFIGWRG